jgi:hypothetical protein
MNNTIDPSDEARQNVWMIMSDLFLDNELNANWKQQIAEDLAKSPYSIEDLTSIYEDEVAPVLNGNLKSIAGQWSMFSRDEVIPLMFKRVELLNKYGKEKLSGIAPIAAVKRWYTLHDTEALWQEIIANVRSIRERTN